MSIRGGYCFVIDGKEYIVYTGNNSEFSALGDTVLEWVRDFTEKNSSQQNSIKDQISGLVEVQPYSPVPENIISEVLREYPYVRPVSINNDYDWYSIMRQVANSPEDLLGLEHYIDGSWMIDDVDCSYLYVVDFDEEVFEIYYDTYKGKLLPATGRFNARTYSHESEVTRQEAQYINLLISYPFSELPDTVAGLNEDVYEDEFWELYLPKTGN